VVVIFKTFGILSCVFWQVDTIVSKYSDAFIFRIKESKDMKASQFLEAWKTLQQMAHHNNREGLNLNK